MEARWYAVQALLMLLYSALGDGRGFYAILPFNKCPSGRRLRQLIVSSSSADCAALGGQYSNPNCYLYFCLVDKILQKGLYLAEKGRCGTNLVARISLSMQENRCGQMGYTTGTSLNWVSCGGLEICRPGDGGLDEYLSAAVPSTQLCPAASKVTYAIVRMKTADCNFLEGGHNYNPDPYGWLDCHFHFCRLSSFKFLWDKPADPGVISLQSSKMARSALVGHTTETSAIRNCMLCVMRCKYHRDCLSVNCGKETSASMNVQCQLNNANLFYAPSSMVSHPYLSYYDIRY